MTDKLRAHVEKMQDMARRYLEPADYVGLMGKVANKFDDEARSSLFEDDIIYMLDGPEQREAMS